MMITRVTRSQSTALKANAVGVAFGVVMVVPV
jgi:hypothetical protein